MQQILEDAFKAALHATKPRILLASHLKQLHNNHQVPDFILAFGKAACSMAEAALDFFPDVPTLVIPPKDSLIPHFPTHVQICPSNHPIPSQQSVVAAQAALAAMSALTEKQRALVLISGGGSSLLALPYLISLEEKQQLTQQLLKSGATIQEINTIRQLFSQIKGGKLAQCTSAHIQSFILSDIVGDPFHLIASGPTVPTQLSPAQALRILDKYHITNPHIRLALKQIQPQTLPPQKRLQHHLVGSNRNLLEAAKQHLTRRNIQVVILSDTFTGEASILAQFHAQLAKSILRHQTPFKRPIVLLSGGEATVTVRGQGSGGRNQEFALALLKELKNTNIWCLSAGSDGIDGTSNAAGAWITPDSYLRAQAQDLNLQQYLDNNDSANFFTHLDDQFITGPTGHNLNDFRALAIGFTDETG